MRRMTIEHRAIVTNDIADFQAIHNRTLARSDEHYGMVFSLDATMPRNKASVPLWVQTLAEFLSEHKDEGAMQNRVHHLP